MHRKPVPVNVCIVGASNVGKTTVLNRLLNSSADKTASNAASQLHHHHVSVNNEKIALDVWDTNGEERLRSFLTDYYHVANLLIAIFDVTDHESLVTATNMIKNAKNINPKLVVMLIANKIDLINQPTSISDDEITEVSILCDIVLRTQAKDLNASRDIQDIMQSAIQLVIGRVPESQELVVFSENSTKEDKQRLTKKLAKAHEKYAEIMSDRDNMIEGIRALFHDYAHPRLFSFHLNRHHKNRARLIVENLPKEQDDARQFLINQLDQLTISVKPKFDKSGSMSRRLNYAISKLESVQLDIQQRPRSQ